MWKKSISFSKGVPHIFTTCPGLDLFSVIDKYKIGKKKNPYQFGPNQVILIKVTLTEGGKDSDTSYPYIYLVHVYSEPIMLQPLQDWEYKNESWSFPEEVLCLLRLNI